jgi:hypothetical protein
MKEKRKVTSFEPDSDVLEMLARAKKGGISIGDACNQALRACGMSVIKDILNKRALAVGPVKSPNSESAVEKKGAEDLAAAKGLLGIGNPGRKRTSKQASASKPEAP